MYLCVCLSVPRRIPTLLHGPGCNLGEMVARGQEVLSSCARLGGFAIGARVSLIWQRSAECQQVLILALCLVLSVSLATGFLKRLWMDRHGIQGRASRGSENSPPEGYLHQNRGWCAPFPIFAPMKEIELAYWRYPGDTGSWKCLYIGWQWRNFFISYLCQLFFRHVVASSSAKCFLLGHHFLSKIALIRTFAWTNWYNFIRKTRQIFTTWLRAVRRCWPTEWRSYCDHRYVTSFHPIYISATYHVQLIYSQTTVKKRCN